MKVIRVAILFVVLANNLQTESSASSTDSTDGARAVFLVLGTHHLDPSGDDVFNLEIGDVLGERSQRVSETLVERIAAFTPSRIAIELEPEFMYSLKY